MGHWILLAVCLMVTVCGHTVLGFWGSGCAYNSSNYFTFGRRTYGDRLLYSNHTHQPSSLWGRSSVTVEFPAAGRFPLGTISYLEAVDQRRAGGSCVELRRGGPGSTFVRLRITAPWRSDLHFVINVFGRPFY